MLMIPTGQFLSRGLLLSGHSTLCQVDKATQHSAAGPLKEQTVAHLFSLPCSHKPKSQGTQTALERMDPALAPWGLAANGPQYKAAEFSSYSLPLPPRKGLEATDTNCGFSKIIKAQSVATKPGCQAAFPRQLTTLREQFYPGLLLTVEAYHVLPKL